MPHVQKIKRKKYSFGSSVGIVAKFGKRREKLIKNNNAPSRGTFDVGKCSKDVFGYVDHQKSFTCSWQYHSELN